MFALLFPLINFDRNQNPFDYGLNLSFVFNFDFPKELIDHL